MRDSLFNTVAVPIQGSKNPATLYKADVNPLRIVVRNVGPGVLFLAFNSTDLSDVSSGLAATFQLPAGLSEVFVLAPKQGIYATSLGGNGLASLSVSEAFPEAFSASVRP